MTLTQHNDTQHKDIQHCDIQHIDKLNATQHNDTHHHAEICFSVWLILGTTFKPFILIVIMLSVFVLIVVAPL
jgi:hypothetical protein